METTPIILSGIRLWRCDTEQSLYVDNKGQVYKGLTWCPYCGKTNTIAHTKYSTRCIPCGRVYATYAVYKSQMRKRTFSDASAETLDYLVDYYSQAEQNGYRTPADYKEVGIALQRRLVILHSRHMEDIGKKTGPTITGKEVDKRCDYCSSGRVTVLSHERHKKHRCEACARRYETYRRLRLACHDYERNELSRVLNEYDKLARHDYWSPDTNEVRRRHDLNEDM